MTDTSKDAVERLAAWHDNEAGAWSCDGGRADLARWHRETSAALRALLAERDAARAQWARVHTIATNGPRDASAEALWRDKGRIAAIAVELIKERTP